MQVRTCLLTSIKETADFQTSKCYLPRNHSMNRQRNDSAFFILPVKSKIFSVSLMLIPFQQCSIFPNLMLSTVSVPCRMVCRRKEFKGPVQWAQGIERKEVNRTCMCTCALSIWQILRLGDQLARWENTRNFCSWKLKGEVNHIFINIFIIMVVYVEIAMSPSLGFYTDSSSPSPSLKLFLCPQLHLCMKEPHGMSQSI